MTEACLLFTLFSTTRGRKFLFLDGSPPARRPVVETRDVSNHGLCGLCSFVLHETGTTYAVPMQQLPSHQNYEGYTVSSAEYC